GEEITQGDTLQNTEDTSFSDRLEFKAPARGFAKEGEPVHQITQQKNDQCTLDDLRPEYRPGLMLIFVHHKSHRITNRKQEGRKHQVGGRESMPIRMKQWSVNVIPASRRINNDHETHRHPPKNIEGEETRLQFSHRKVMLAPL